MSRIILDAREYSTSTGRYIERLIHYLQEIDHVNQYLILLKSKDISAFEVKRTNSEHFIAVACDYKEFSFDEQTKLQRQIASLKPDLVHFGMVQQPVLYSGPVVTTIHDLTTVRFTNPAKNRLVYTAKQSIYRRVIKRAAQKSRIIITPTEFVKTDLVNFTGVQPDKIIVTLEAADSIAESPTPLKYLQNKKFIMYLGRPTPHKNLPRLIEAHALLREQHPDLLLVLAGKKDANYERIAANIPAGQQNSVVFTDFVSESELRWLYLNARAYVFPSLSEGFGLPGLEAMISGAPVVSSNATCLPEVYGSAAHYFDPLSVPAMQKAINDVLTNSALRGELVNAGKARAQQYSWKRMAEQTLTIYNQVLSDTKNT
jgi:glycosyltransferase involved in cell wall biosynthesis